MINRLLEQLDNPRRHLTFLVGLLALVFVLTTVVAWRANAAERDRARIALSTLDETAGAALEDWSLLYTTFAGNLLPYLAGGMVDPALTASALLERVQDLDICPECGTPTRVRSALVTDLSTGVFRDAGDPVDEAVISSLMDRVAAGETTRFHEIVTGGLYFTEVAGGSAAALMFVVDDTARGIHRMTALVLDGAAAREMLDMAFLNARLLQKSLAPGASLEDLFAWTARTGSASVVGHGTSSAFRSKPLEEPIYGLTLAVGPTPSAVGYLEFGADPLTERLTMLLLMGVIGALLVLAMLQVRRETELSRLRADFVSGVSHELRTPLAQIRMFTETLLMGRVRSDVERRRSLEIIDQEARRLSHLVENVLLFAKTDGGRGARVMPEPTHFAEEVRQSVESFSLLSRTRDIELRAELQENIMVEVDRMALRQILSNLVDNALKYGPGGQRVTVGAALFDDVVRLWVDDEGPGIPVEDRGRVFDSFYRLPRDVDSRVSGSGIGLAVVRELARLHGGNAWAENAPVRGARIVVEFPDAYLRTGQTDDFAAAS